MDFDSASGDDDYPRASQAFLDRLEAWVVERRGEDDGTLRADAEMFVDWNHNYRGSSLGTLARSDIDDYLLDWLPRKYMGSSADAPGIVDAVQCVVEFLAALDELDGGTERAASLIAHSYDIADRAAAGLGDRSKFGIGKSLLSASLVDSDGASLPDLSDLLADSELTIEELQPLLEARMNAFNDLSFEERKRLTDPALQPRQVPLEFTFVPPAPPDVESSAARSEIVRMVDGFVSHATHHGIALTSRGNIKIADARTLVAELETPDTAMQVASSLDYRWLTLIDDLATETGAVERLRTKIRSDGSWLALTATDRATRLAETILFSGFLSSSEYAPGWLHEQRGLLDDGVPHWFSVGLIEGALLPVEDITSHALEVCAMQQPDRRDQIGADLFDGLVIAALGELFEGLERFGLLNWHSRQRAVRPMRGREYSVGGELELTPLGRHVLPDVVRNAGYTFDEVESIEQATAQQMLNIALAGGIEGAEILARWRTDLDLVSRLELVAECIIDGDAPNRLVGFDIFTAVDDIATVAPIVRQLLDSPAGAYAATFLLEHDAATFDEVGGFIDLTPIIDMLSVSVGDAEMFDEGFQNANQQIDGDFIEELWRHDQPETAWVLDAAGKYVTDKALAKRARKAAMQHRTWMTNQGR